MEIEVNGVKAHYVDRGEGPVIVLLHGIGMSVHSWRFNIGPLSRSFRVIAVDLPGFGGSGKPERFLYDLTGFARWVCALLDALGVSRAAFVGNSMGGGVAYTIATSEPERVASLVFVDSVGYQPRSERFFVFRILQRRWIGELALAALNPIGVQLILRTTDFNSAPGPVPCARPTLILWGDRDRIVPLAHAGRFARDLPDAKLHVFGNCGHFPQVERAEAFNQQVEAFVAAHP